MEILGCGNIADQVQIVDSILDTDMYKLTMQQAVLLQHSSRVRYRFFDRNNTVYPDGFGDALREQIRTMEDLRLTDDEAWYLKSLPFFEDWYVDFLKGYRFDRNEVDVDFDEGYLEIEIEGPWYRTILWETPLLSIISELYYKEAGKRGDTIDIREKAKDKVNEFEGTSAEWKVAEFGSRRRFSRIAQEFFLWLARKNYPHRIAGTSNLYFAHELGLKPIGTMAHEWVSYHGAKYGYRSANKMALQNWTDVYDGDLGIALIDTFTTPVFLRMFNKKFAKLFDGVRQDSGDPFEIGAMVIEHYKDLGIDPRDKTIVFSDGLTLPKADEIYKHFKDHINVSFGIGTNLTNYVDVEPMNIVFKMVEAEVRGEKTPVIKISDSEGKHTGDEDEIAASKQVLGIG